MIRYGSHRGGGDGRPPERDGEEHSGSYIVARDTTHGLANKHVTAENTRQLKLKQQLQSVNSSLLWNETFLELLTSYHRPPFY